MSGSIVSLVAAVLALGAYPVLAEGGTDLTGAWTLEERSSDDPVRVLRDGDHGRGRASRVKGNVSIFGIPVGLPRPEEEDDEDEYIDDVRGVEHLFEATYRLRIRQEADFTEIQYGNEPVVGYRHAAKVERDGVVARADWQNGILTVEHELADGARLSERYWIEERSGELNWTARLKRGKAPTVDVKRIFYRARTTEP